MAKPKSHPIMASFAAGLFFLNTLFWCLLLYVFVPIKLLIRVKSVQDWCGRRMTAISEHWISCNDWEIDNLRPINWRITGLEGLRQDRSYLVCSNHRSWVDIVVLQHVFNRRIPFLRFFLKRELIYVPLLGAAWWALDFPFMKRYSKSYLAHHPEKRGQDLETTRRSCERFRGKPISVLNFLEGTRFTPAKKAKSKSPYENLLPPKTGGVAFVIEAMGAQFDALLDVTLHYPTGLSSMWDLFSGNVKEVCVNVRSIPIPKEFLSGKYQEDEGHREALQNWVKDLWVQKDAMLGQMRVADTLRRS